MAIDLEAARAKMVVEQLQRRGIKDQRVLAAMGAIPRHRFISAQFADRAYDDGPLPIGAEQTISQPYMVALMTEVCIPGADECALEVGTGSGYQTAILSELCGSVYSVECVEHLHQRARLVLDAIGAANCFLRYGDGSLGWPEAAPFDMILVTAALPGIPRTLLSQLSPTGRLVAPVGNAELQTLVRITRHDGHWREDYFGECRFVKMVGAEGFRG